MNDLSPEMYAMFFRIQRAGKGGYYFPPFEYRTAKALEKRGKIIIEDRCIAKAKAK